MKKPNKTHTLLHLAAALSLGLCLVAPTSSLRAETSPGDDSGPANTRDSTGIITAVSPGQSITVDSKRGPFTYRLGRDLHVSGADSKPLTIEQVHKGQKATVYYYHRGGEDTVARLVILADKSAKTH